MSASLKELKERLRRFLAAPQAEQEFRVWFALALRDAHKSTDHPEFESLAHMIQESFAQAAEGDLSAADLRTILEAMSDDSKPANRVVLTQSARVLPSVNHFDLEEVRFPAVAVSAGKAREGVFWSAEPLPI